MNQGSSVVFKITGKFIIKIPPYKDKLFRKISKGRHDRLFYLIFFGHSFGLKSNLKTTFLCPCIGCCRGHIVFYGFPYVGFMCTNVHPSVRMCVRMYICMYVILLD